LWNLPCPNIFAVLFENYTKWQQEELI
jgi:hypothetical protein